MENFKVHNSVRDVETKMLRKTAARSPKMKQYLGGGELRVMRGRPVVLTREQLEPHLEELKERVAEGVLWVSDMEDREVDLSTLAPLSEKAADPPAPKVVLDSANNDKNQGIGENIPQFAGGLPLGAVPPTGAVGGIPGPLEAETADQAPPTQDEPVEGAEVAFEDPVAAKSGKKGKK